ACVVDVTTAPRKNAVTGRVMDGAEAHPVRAKQAGILVQLVFDVRGDGNFDDAVENLRGLVAKLHVVPGVHKTHFPNKRICFGVSIHRNNPGPRGGRLDTSIAQIEPFLNSMLRFRFPVSKSDASSARSRRWATSNAPSN